MRFSVRWLRNYLKTEISTKQIIEALYDCGLEVEQVIDLGLVSGKLVVGEILKIDAIEGADKIRLCTVKVGEPEPLKIVCGAQNIEAGQKVPVARFGMVFPDGFELKPRKIMGIEGQGMLCSPKEIGIADDADGIWILDPDTPVGEPFDAVIEIAITPNRPDALSIIGVARDLAAKIVTMPNTKKPELTLPDLAVEESAEKVDTVARVTVEAREDCPRYAARVVKGVQVGPSPRWLQLILESAGMRPINNIVDITNFVLLEYGHPLHAFDLDLLNGSQIVVRNAKEGEKIETLDGQTHDLLKTDLLICDAKRPVALAGIMGGGNSEIHDGTVNILIESAYFRPTTIRKTSKRLDKSTEASYRFERGTDPKGVTAALNRCAQLISEYANGNVCKGILDVASGLPKKDQILVRIARLNKFLGLELTGRQITEILTPLGFEVLRADKEEMLIDVPTHRVDVSMEADIYEEVARIYGYGRIAERTMNMPSAQRPPVRLDALREELSDAAVALGFCQAVNLSFINESGNAIIGADDKRQVHVLNPIHADMSVMRRGLLPSLLQNVSTNLNKSVEDIALFEVGNRYEFESEEPAEELDRMAHPAVETPVFALAITGRRAANWRDGEKPVDFFDVKGYAEYFLGLAGLKKLVIEEAAQIEWLHPGRSARFLVKGQPVALFGEVHPALLKKLGIKKPVFYLEIPLTGAILTGEGRAEYREIPRFPAVTRDIALVVDESVRSLDLERTIKKAAKDLLAGLRIFDVYQGEHVEKGKKSLAYSLTYRAVDRTLKEDEVNAAHNAVVDALASSHGAVLRG